MGAGQRGLADILPHVKASIEPEGLGQLLCAAVAATSDITSPGEQADTVPRRQEEDANRKVGLAADDEAEEVPAFEGQIRQLIARINWLQESLQLEEESRQAAENQAESLRLACSQQADKVEELSEQISMLFQDLDEQHKHWTSLEAKLEFEQQERLHIEATLKALAAGPVHGICSSPSPPSPPFPATASNGGGAFLSDGWSSPQASPSPTTVVEGCRESWDSVNSGASKGGSCKAANMFKELNSEWSNYKSEGKLGSWSLAKVLRRLSFSDVKKKRVCGGGNGDGGGGGGGVSNSTANAADSGRVYDTAKLTEEIFSLNSEASDVRERHLADLRNRLELQHHHGDRLDDRDVELSETWSDYPKPRFKPGKASRSVSRSTTKRHGSQKSFELDNKAHFRIENLGRQVFHLKKMCTEKTQLVKLEKRRRSEVENRYYALVKNLEKQVLQLRKMNLRKADEIKQERFRRQEVEKRNVAEVESLERQVVRLSKLADARAHDFKSEQKQRLEAQKRLKDLVSQLKLSNSKATPQAKPQRSLKVKQSSPKSSLLSSSVVHDHHPRPCLELTDYEVGGRGDEAEFVELEALQFKTLRTSDLHSISERQLWRLQTKQKGRIVLTPVQNCEEHKMKQEEQQVEQELCEVQNEDINRGISQMMSDNDSNSDSLSVATPPQGREGKTAAADTASGSRKGAASSRPGSLTGKISQLKETTTRLLKDLEGTQLLLNSASDSRPTAPDCSSFSATATAVADDCEGSGAHADDGNDDGSGGYKSSQAVEQGNHLSAPGSSPSPGFHESFLDQDLTLKHHLLGLGRDFRIWRGLARGLESYTALHTSQKIAQAVSRDSWDWHGSQASQAAATTGGWVKAKAELILQMVFYWQHSPYRVLRSEGRVGVGGDGGDDHSVLQLGLLEAHKIEKKDEDEYNEKLEDSGTAFF